VLDGRCDLRRRDGRGLRGDGHPRAGGRSVVIEDVVGIVLTLGLIAYLVAALVFPERF
jgi:K+-transporting ATPase KdpF subunit